VGPGFFVPDLPKRSNLKKAVFILRSFLAGGHQQNEPESTDHSLVSL
jgi:hypothetical protein